MAEFGIKQTCASNPNFGRARLQCSRSVFKSVPLTDYANAKPTGRFRAIAYQLKRESCA